MKPATLLGIVLIIGGAAALAFGSFSYKQESTVFKVGSFEATTQETKTVPLQYAGGGLVLVGIVLVAVGARRK